ncbi:MAG: capsular biosynthesis protein [Flavobacteriales bacterium]|nr:capsular biosynthesis protein [Flavobacteriales bacterium]
MGIFDFFKSDKPNEIADTTLKVDFHSHLLPGIDDGCQTMEDTLENIRELQSQGIEKILTTPHIFKELYPNTPEIIREKLELVRKTLKDNDLQIEIHAAAEYYLDEWFIQNFKNMEILTIKDKYILVETNYMERPHFLQEILFELQISGYKVILAHPERYNYLLSDFRQFEDLFNTGVLFQCNLLSFTGYYSPVIKKAAHYLLKNKMVHMVGSDIHKIKHSKTIGQFKKTKEYKDLMKLNLLNNSL